MKLNLKPSTIIEKLITDYLSWIINALILILASIIRVYLLPFLNNLLKNISPLKQHTPIVLDDVVPPHPATPFMQLGVRHKILFSTFLGSCNPVMNGVGFYCNSRSNEQSRSQLAQRIQIDGAKHILA